MTRTCTEPQKTNAVLKRLGYLSEALGPADEGFLTECERRLSAGIALLDPSAQGVGERNARWRLRANVRVEPRVTNESFEPAYRVES